MKVTVKGRRYVFILSPHLSENGGVALYKCRHCVADPQKHQDGDDALWLHTALSDKVPKSKQNMLCEGGRWIHDSKAGRAQAVLFMLEDT